jgi:putative peptide zinc metalloprotease protein
MQGIAAAPTSAAGEPVLCLRRDLRSALHENRGDRYFLVEDPAREAFFRLGLSEWHFATKLDGETSMADAFSAVQEELGDGVLTKEKAQSVCQWLMRSGLLRSGQAAPPVAAAPEVRGPGLLMSAFFFRIPLCHPDRFLDKAVPWCGWLFSWPVLLCWTLLVAMGLASVLNHWSRFQSSAAAYFSPNTWLYLAVVWVVLKIVHEFFHAIACKHFGGRVGSSGIAFILFAPVAYVDVTSAWTFRSKWHRIWTSAAGMYVEFAFAAVAAIVWSSTTSPFVENVCHSVIMAASVTTLLFNGNPLMRFDGYYIITDLLEIQNLYGIAREHVRSKMRQWFFGLPATGEPLIGWSGWVTRAYGWCSACWRIIVCVSMMLGAATLFHGAGICLAIAAGCAWFGKPFFNLVRYLMSPPETQQPSVSRFLTLTGAITVGTLILVILPYPGGVSAPAIVDFEPLNYVRSEAAGFVEDVRVATGDIVESGQVMMTIRNDELQTGLIQVGAELDQAQLRARILHRENDMALYQAEQERIAALTEKRNNLQRQVQGLQVRAPSAGQVLSRRLYGMEGQYVEVGATLAVVGSTDAKAVLASVPEEYVEAFEANVGGKPHVWVRGYGRTVQEARLVRVEPTASDVLRHVALGGNAGGPIPVRAMSSGDQDARVQSQFRMIAPRFHAVVELGKEESDAIEAGQLAEVRFTDWSESVGKKLHRVVTSWIGSKLGRANAG